MADFSITGFIIGIRYNEKNVVVTIAENRKGYERADGLKVEDSVVSWTVYYKPHPFKKFISEYFGSGMLVQIKGDILPYAMSAGEIEQGYTIYGQTINRAAYPKNIRRDVKMQKESISHSLTSPDLQSYEQDDF